MDEKNSPPTDPHNASSSISLPSDLKTEFWKSRGNMGEKINTLVGLNVLTLNLTIKILLKLSESLPVPEDIMREVRLINDFIIALQAQPDSDLQLIEKITTLQSKLDGLLETDIPKETLIMEVNDQSKPIIAAKEQIGVFDLDPYYTDSWGLIESLRSFMDNYTNLSHIAFPYYYFEGCKEIFRFRIQKEINDVPNHEIYQIPSQKLQELIEKLLREAPSARLLQNLKKLFPDETGKEILPFEKEEVQDIIKQYFFNVSAFLLGKRNLSDSLRVSMNVLRGFNLGPGDLETRIPNVSFNIVKSCYQEMKMYPQDEFRQFLYSETMILIHKINDSLLANERYVRYLRRLK
ncbi:hypothetical protein [Candidatus Hodarchaeum mangrovi]